LGPRIEAFLEAAVEHIGRYGDTDVLPFPIEHHIFYDMQEAAASRLLHLHEHFDAFLDNDRLSPHFENVLAAVGYSGFRSVTQIDPLWNAYLLALVMSVGEDIERARIPRAEGVVFSYRFQPDGEAKTVFAKDAGWPEFQARATELAQAYRFVLVTDISDFYARVYHHRLKNALDEATQRRGEVKRIDTVLNRLSDGASFGLPVGGPAARLLSECLLNVVDQLLIADGIRFCRFADDYRLYAADREEAQRHLISLSMAMQKFGLSLQKGKTRILSREEFLATAGREDGDVPGSDIVTQQFLALKLHYDPYSATADSDYRVLADELNKFDIVGMLAREIRKSRVNQLVTRKLIRSVQYLDALVRDHAILSLLESLPILYPVFPTVCHLLKSQIEQGLDKGVEVAIFKRLHDLVRRESYIILVPTNLAYAVRVLAHDTSQEAYELLNRLFKTTSSTSIKADIILAMARLKRTAWVTARLDEYWRLGPWEQRSLIVASYCLDDRGRHWRDKLGDKAGLPPLHSLAMEWAAQKKNSGTWTVPI
jgi:hypothetical protein